MKNERKRDIIIIGHGGHAKSVCDSINMHLYNIVGYTDLYDKESIYKYLGNDNVLEEYFIKGVENAFICVGHLEKDNFRKSLYNKVKKIGYALPVITDPSAIISKSASIEEGSFVGKGCVINADCKIGKMTIINTRSLIEHECIIDNFVHIAVGAVICGGCRIQENSFIGANATIIQGISIGKNSVIGAGTVVISDVPDNCMAVGVPGRIVKRINNG